MNNEKAYTLGFLRCAEWAKRDDLPSDVDSPAYARDMQCDLEAEHAKSNRPILKSLLRKPLNADEKLVCYCPPGICQAPKGFSGPCNRAVPEKQTDPVVEAVRKDLLDRSTVGIEKYRTTLAGNNGDKRYWIQHAYEEALDLANYLKRLLMEIDNGN